MAIGRYDQRKNDEAIEANVIGTEYDRAGLLEFADAERTRDLLKKYLAQRVLFYTLHNPRDLAQVGRQTAQLQRQMWSVVQAAATAKPSAPKTLVAAGMNEVLDSAGYTHSAISVVVEDMASEQLSGRYEVGITRSSWSIRKRRIQLRENL
jgi:hypothetical protein